MYRFFLLLVSLTLIVMIVFPAQAQTSSEVDRALAWLREQQQPDGGFSNGFAPGSDPGTTADAVLAIVAGGQDPATWTVGAETPITYLAAAARSQAPTPGLAAKLALAAAAAGGDPSDLGGVDLITAIEGGFDQSTGLIGGAPYDSALAILALRVAGRPIPAEAVDGLLAFRLDDGSFSFNGDRTPGAGDSNTTALVVQALAAAERSDGLSPSIEYFRSTQNPDGGWTYQKPSAFGEATDANSTALVLQALRAAGEDPAGWGDPARTLESLQLPNGAFIFNAATSSENLLATVQAVPAMAGLSISDIGHSVAAETAPLDGGWLDARLVAATLIGLVAILIGMTLVARRGKRQA